MSSDKVENRDPVRWPDSNTAFKPVYPLNRVDITPSGHEVHYDDTPGNRRIRIAHASGSYSEIANDGRLTTVTVGNEHKYCKQGITISIDQNQDIKIGGHSTIKVDGGAHIETKGETRVVMGGGKHSIQALGDLKIGAKNIDVVAQQTLNLGGKDVNVDSFGGTVTVRGPSVRILGYSELLMNSLGETSMKSDGPTKIGASTLTAVADRIDLN